MADKTTHGMKRKLLVLASTFPRWKGDTEPAFVYELSARLTASFSVTALVPHAPGAQMEEDWDGLRVRRFRYMWPARWERLAYGGILPNIQRDRLLLLQVPLFLAGELAATLRLVKRERIDLIHAHWVVPQGFVAALVRQLTGIPVLITAHGADMYALNDSLVRKLKQWTLNHCDGITAVSTSLVKKIQELNISGSRPVHVISMGVDTTFFQPSQDDGSLRERFGIKGPFLLFVGRLAEKKGVRYLIDAMPQVLKELPDSTLVIVGDGPLRNELETQAQRQGVGGNVRFVGALPREALSPYYAAADVFVGPSIETASGDTEGLPVVFAEAMASGCAVVGTAVGGTSDIIRHRETGLLVESASSEALATAINELLSSAAEARRMAVRGRRWVKQQFDSQRVADRYAHLLLEAAGSGDRTKIGRHRPVNGTTGDAD